MDHQSGADQFQSKEDVLRAVVGENGRVALAGLEAAWAEDETLEQKLATYQRIGPLSWYQEVRAAPDWSDILEGLNKTASKELAGADRIWVPKLETMLSQHVRQMDGSAAETRDISEFFYNASKNAKYGVENTEEMKARLDTILEATLALLRSRGLKID